MEWLAGEVSRGDALHLVHAGQALSRYDARPWAASIDKRASVLVTTGDHLVKPWKQRRLANSLRAEMVDIRADHLATWMQPDEYARLTVQQVLSVSALVTGLIE